MIKTNIKFEDALDFLNKTIGTCKIYEIKSTSEVQFIKGGKEIESINVIANEKIDKLELRKGLIIIYSIIGFKTCKSKKYIYVSEDDTINSELLYSIEKRLSRPIAYHMEVDFFLMNYKKEKREELFKNKKEEFIKTIQESITCDDFVFNIRQILSKFE